MWTLGCCSIVMSISPVGTPFGVCNVNTDHMHGGGWLYTYLERSLRLPQRVVLRLPNSLYDSTRALNMDNEQCARRARSSRLTCFVGQVGETSFPRQTPSMIPHACTCAIEMPHTCTTYLHSPLSDVCAQLCYAFLSPSSDRHPARGCTCTTTTEDGREGANGSRMEGPHHK